MAFYHIESFYPVGENALIRVQNIFDRLINYVNSHSKLVLKQKTFIDTEQNHGERPYLYIDNDNIYGPSFDYYSPTANDGNLELGGTDISNTIREASEYLIYLTIVIGEDEESFGFGITNKGFWIHTIYSKGTLIKTNEKVGVWSAISNSHSGYRSLQYYLGLLDKENTFCQKDYMNVADATNAVNISANYINLAKFYEANLDDLLFDNTYISVTKPVSRGGTIEQVNDKFYAVPDCYNTYDVNHGGYCPKIYLPLKELND